MSRGLRMAIKAKFNPPAEVRGEPYEMWWGGVLDRGVWGEDFRDAAMFTEAGARLVVGLLRMVPDPERIYVAAVPVVDVLAV